MGDWFTTKNGRRINKNNPPKWYKDLTNPLSDKNFYGSNWGHLADQQRQNNPYGITGNTGNQSGGQTGHDWVRNNTPKKWNKD